MIFFMLSQDISGDMWFPTDPTDSWINTLMKDYIASGMQQSPDTCIFFEFPCSFSLKVYSLLNSSVPSYAGYLELSCALAEFYK
jgi:hypothetical protein